MTRTFVTAISGAINLVDAVLIKVVDAESLPCRETEVLNEDGIFVVVFQVL